MSDYSHRVAGDFYKTKNDCRPEKARLIVHGGKSKKTAWVTRLQAKVRVR